MSEIGDAWHVASHVLVRAWDGEIVAYNDETGHTHQFLELAAWALERLSGSAMTEHDLMMAAAAELELEATGDLVNSLRNSIALLRGLGLIQGPPQA